MTPSCWAASQVCLVQVRPAKLNASSKLGGYGVVATATRARYRPSGLFDPLRLAVLLPANLLVAYLMASLLAVAGSTGWYMVVAVPFILTLPLAGLGYVG